MKKAIMVLAIMGLWTGPALSSGSGFGLGVIVGEPTGISFKSRMSARSAVDGAAAWSVSDENAFQFHMDYLLHNYDLFTVEGIEGRLPFYFGVGGRVKFHDDSSAGDDGDTVVGVRLPLGINYLAAGPPLDFFFEIVPTMDLVPDTDFELNAGLGMRFYFR